MEEQPQTKPHPLSTANKAIQALKDPGSVLLFVIVLAGIITLGIWAEQDQRMRMVGGFLTEIEGNRSQEMRECMAMLRQVLVSRNYARSEPGAGD